MPIPKLSEMQRVAIAILCNPECYWRATVSMDLLRKKNSGGSSERCGARTHNSLRGSVVHGIGWRRSVRYRSTLSLPPTLFASLLILPGQ